MYKIRLIIRFCIFLVIINQMDVLAISTVNSAISYIERYSRLGFVDYVAILHEEDVLQHDYTCENIETR